MSPEFINKIGKKTGLVILEFICLYIPFCFMDLSVRLIGNGIGFYKLNKLAPNLFSLAWGILFFGIVILCKGIIKKILYWLFCTIVIAEFLTQMIYYPLTNIYFGFSLVEMAGEGSDYIMDTILGTPYYTWLLLVFGLALMILNYFLFIKNEKYSFSDRLYIKIIKLIIVIVVFIAIRGLAITSLGDESSELLWDNFDNPRNVYNSFSDCNRCMQISGLYEYMTRNFYVTYLKKTEAMTDNDKSFLDECYDNTSIHLNNQYTGVFEGKNVIFLQLEGIDSWLLTKENMPNLYSLYEKSIRFNQHYSIYTGGGSTFNSEFAVNTGFTTPISYNKNVYTLTNNTFPNTMARKLGAKGYTIDAFHMNSQSFYSRGINYRRWGFDNYYGLLDIGNYDENVLDYELDRELILNKDFYNKMFKKNESFVNYIITYTPHTPFTASKGIGQYVAQMNYGDDIDSDKYNEEDIVRLEAKETDYMVGLLIQALKDNNLYHNTIIVAYADHYLYTIKDKEILDNYKITEDNRINNTPFFIWNADNEELQNVDVDKATMQTNILPTVLNLLGIEFNNEDYLAEDALASDYEGIVFFSDYSWFDGNAYVKDGQVTNGAKISASELERKTLKVTNMIRKNDLTLKYDYLRR